MWTTSTACNTIAHLPVAMLTEIGANLVWENTWVDYTANWLHKVTWTDERWQKNTNVSSSLMLGFKDVITSSLPETATGLAVWISHHVCSWPISYHVSCNYNVLCQHTRSISPTWHAICVWRNIAMGWLRSSDHTKNSARSGHLDRCRVQTWWRESGGRGGRVD